VWTLLALVLVCLAGFMGYSGEYLAAALLALFGLGAMACTGSGSYITHCPICDTELRGLIGLKRCPKCLCYGKVSDGAYYELQPDCVTEVPLLALPLGDRREMPLLCCACGAPAARSERLRVAHGGRGPGFGTDHRKG
jgi:hypothetical protein